MDYKMHGSKPTPLYSPPAIAVLYTCFLMQHMRVKKIPQKPMWPVVYARKHEIVRKESFVLHIINILCM